MGKNGDLIELSCGASSLEEEEEEEEEEPQGLKEEDR
jgi:hypothetical protein